MKCLSWIQLICQIHRTTALKPLENPGNVIIILKLFQNVSREFHENPWTPLKRSCNLKKLPETSPKLWHLSEDFWNSLKHTWNPWETIETPWNASETPNKPQNVTEIPWNFLKHSRSPLTPLKPIETLLKYLKTPTPCEAPEIPLKSF